MQNFARSVQNFSVGAYGDWQSYVFTVGFEQSCRFFLRLLCQFFFLCQIPNKHKVVLKSLLKFAPISFLQIDWDLDYVVLDYIVYSQFRRRVVAEEN